MRIRKHEKEKELGREKERLLEEDTNINQEGNMLKKPPIGIEPRNIWEKKRIKALKAAIKRYVDADMEVPIEWVKELNEVCGREKSENKSSELNETAPRKENATSKSKDIYDSHHPRYFSLDTFKNAIPENEKGDNILRSVILASKDADKNTLMLKNIANVADENGKNVIVFCSDERQCVLEKEDVEEISKIKDYAQAIRQDTANIKQNDRLMNVMFIFDFGNGSLLDYNSDRQLIEDIYFLAAISRVYNNYVFFTCNEIFTSIERFESKYYPLYILFNIYQEESDVCDYEILLDQVAIDEFSNRLERLKIKG